MFVNQTQHARILQQLADNKILINTQKDNLKRINPNVFTSLETKGIFANLEIHLTAYLLGRAGFGEQAVYDSAYEHFQGALTILRNTMLELSSANDQLRETKSCLYNLLKILNEEPSNGIKRAPTLLEQQPHVAATSRAGRSMPPGLSDEQYGVLFSSTIRSPATTSTTAVLQIIQSSPSVVAAAKAQDQRAVPSAAVQRQAIRSPNGHLAPQTGSINRPNGRQPTAAPASMSL